MLNEFCPIHFENCRLSIIKYFSNALIRAVYGGNKNTSLNVKLNDVTNNCHKVITNIVVITEVPN